MKLLIRNTAVIGMALSMAGGLGHAAEFSAEQVRILGEREQRVTLYVSDAFVREEMGAEGQGQFRIIDLREGRMRIHNPARMEFIDLPAPPVPRDPEQVCAKVEQLRCNMIGEDQVDGRTVQQWSAQMRGPQDMILEMRALYDPELRYPVWMRLDPGMEQRLESIRIAPQNPVLFETPAGYVAAEAQQTPES
ncbi:MAG: hypothetical protein ACO376_03995 [Gammaproteobacteria bacterium]